MTLRLPYQPPYHWPAMLAFLAARAVPSTERIVDGVYHRTMRAGVAVMAAPSRRQDGCDLQAQSHPTLQGRSDHMVAGTASVFYEPDKAALRVEFSPSLARGAPDALAQLAQLFDSACDPDAIAQVLGELALPDPGLRLPGAVDPFEITVRAILGQQITVAAARTLATRFVTRFGEPLSPATTGHEEPNQEPNQEPKRLTHLFPSAAAIAGLDVAQLGELGIIRARGQAIIDIAAALSTGRLQLIRRAGTPAERNTPPDDAELTAVLAALNAIRGVGPWTAHYVAMRALGWADAFPPGDVVARKVLGAATPAAAIAMAERWRPWRAYALMHLWRRSALSVR